MATEDRLPEAYREGCSNSQDRAPGRCDGPQGYRAWIFPTVTTEAGMTLTPAPPPRPRAPVRVKDPKPRSRIRLWLSRQTRRLTQPLRRAWAWLGAHWGWGWHGHSVDKVRQERYNLSRRQITAYCQENGVSRKTAKKQFTAFKKHHRDRARLQRALADARRAGRAPYIDGIRVTPGAASGPGG